MVGNSKIMSTGLQWLILFTLFSKKRKKLKTYQKQALPPISCVFSRFRFFFWTNILSRKSSVFATKTNIEFYTGRANSNRTLFMPNALHFRLVLLQKYIFKSNCTVAWDFNLIQAVVICHYMCLIYSILICCSRKYHMFD